MEEEEDTFEPDDKMVKAAIVIQKVFRGYSYRHDRSLQETLQFKAKLIQNTWRAYVERRKIHRVIEILALFRINRTVASYRLRIHARKQRYRLQQFDQLLNFYPAKSIVPIPRPKARATRGKGKKGRSSSVASSTKTTQKKSESRNNTSSASKSRTTSSKNRSAPVRESAPVRSTGTRSGPRMKRKTFIQLPPPWHGKDPKRLSQSQQDDLLYTQKSNVDWVKKELIPQLLRDCNPMLNERDELSNKNERYRERLVSKSFICPVPRGMKSLGLKAPKVISFIGDGLLTFVASSVGSVILEPKSITIDNVLYSETFDIEAPLLDVAIHPTSGQVIGIDSHWTLRLFEHGRTILTYELAPEVKVPKASRFLNFDKFGFLWVNLFPQRGPLLLIDPLTLQPSLQINLDNVAQLHRFIRTVVSLVPLYWKEQPFGFAGVFSETTDVYIFSYDFQKSKKLSHPRMKGFPIVKQSNQRIYIWSSDAVVYVYELKEYFEGITRIASFKLKSSPLDLCTTSDPDMIYITCEDFTLHVLLGKTTEHPLRLCPNRLDRDELKFCDILLGPITYTKSRNAFKEMAVYKFTAMPTKFAVFPFSDKMTLVSAIFESGNLCSVWMVNDSQSVRCVDFDSFHYSSPQLSSTLASNNFNDNILVNQKKRADFMETIEFINKYDIHANRGLMNNMFNPKTKKFQFVKYMFTIDARIVYQFIPENDIPMRYISAYELYHFLTRTHILPEKTSTFAAFLERFAPPQMLKPLPMVDLIMNPKLPVRTQSYYMSIVDIKFDAKRVTEIFDELDPFAGLNEHLDKFTISKTIIVPDPNVKITLQRSWLSILERKELNQRLSYLSVLEDMVKQELMNRVQQRLQEGFDSTLLAKIQPISSIDITQHAARNDHTSVNFTTQPIRNPLLDQKRHKSIYDSWSKFTLYGKDEALQMNVLALHIPSHLFNSKSVQAHFDLARKVSNASKKVSSIVHSFSPKIGDSKSLVVITEDPRALPLSHYLTIHSFLGGTSRLISVVRSICSNLLVSLYQFHKAGVIIRTVYPDNILLNAANLSVTFGSSYDCQKLSSNGRTVYLPLPKEFAKITNPYLPPEYFHESPGKYTTAFDIWQFGMTLLYLITGFLPVSYGSELMKHLEDDSRLPKELHVVIDSSNPLDDAPVYPRPIFFYDWMKNAPLVSEKERCTGERGECFFTMPTEPKNGLGNQISNTGSLYPPTILELDNYKLFPVKNLKATFDETRLFIDIIASCLQINPEKRPTAEELLRTYPFSQTAQINDILDNYMRTPDPNIFVAQFFHPVLRTLCPETFSFAIGIISSLLFFQELIDDDAPFAFPLDQKATEKVIESLFDIKFIDQLVAFVLKQISETIQVSDVNPNITYENENFNSLHRFFTRFVGSVEKGSGALINHVDEVIMALLAFYIGCPQLRFSSLVIKANGEEMSELINHDNAALYVFTHTKLHGLVKYALDASPFINKSLKRSAEHNDSYFDNFLSFSNSVYSFAHALCCTVEKQRANAIKTMAGKFSNGQSTTIVRMFLDFHIFQKVIHCFYQSAARNDACSFICSAFRAARMKSTDAAYVMMQKALNTPAILLHCTTAIKAAGNDGLKLPAIEIIRNVLFGSSLPAIADLVYDDVLTTLTDNCKDTIFHNLVSDTVSYSSILLKEVILVFPSLYKTLTTSGIEMELKINYKNLTEPSSNLADIQNFTKKLTTFLFTRQTPIYIEQSICDYPVTLSSEFFIIAMKSTLKECETVAHCLDTQAYKATKFEIQPLSAKSKGKPKEVSFQASQDLINEMCELLLYMFQAFCYFWRKTHCSINAHLIDYLKEFLVTDIPYCRSIPHPSSQVHHVVELMFLFIFQTMPPDNQIFNHLSDFSTLWANVMHQGIIFVIQSGDKDTALLHLFEKYPMDRRMRTRMFNALLFFRFDMAPIFKVIVNEMLWNKTEVKFDMSDKISKTYRFPIRSEAIHLILKVLRYSEKFEKAAKLMAKELAASNFLENERHLTELDDNWIFVDTSMQLLGAIVESTTVFSETIIKEASVQLDSLKVRFYRVIHHSEIIQKERKKYKSQQATSPSMKETWQKPLTSLQKRNNTFGPMKINRTARPATAFASTRKKLLTKPISPRHD